jgi:plasmid stabilization system protein ParE
MSYFVRLRAEAEHDLKSVAAWYERQKYQLGQEFLDELMKVRRTLSESPLMYAAVYRQTHRAVFKRFPFGVYYRVEGDEVVIVAIMHGSRHPRRWHGRI